VEFTKRKEQGGKTCRGSIQCGRHWRIEESRTKQMARGCTAEDAALIHRGVDSAVDIVALGEVGYRGCRMDTQGSRHCG
jgi:hypothetical protein